MNDLTPLLTAEAMRAADAHTIDTIGIPGRVLMETAGQHAARYIASTYGPLRGRLVRIACGKGNNGGDGLVVARALLDRGARVEVWSPITPSGYSGDAGGNATVLMQLSDAYGDALTWTTVREPSDVPAPTHAPPAVCVDALLGTGLDDAPREPIAALICDLNETAAPTVALDVPSGLNSDTGQAHQPTVQAEATVTFGAAKIGLHRNDGPSHAGLVETARIGIPQHVLHERAHGPGAALGTTDAYVRNQVPERGRDAHKYNVGMALVVGGSPPYTGAPMMAAQAAARSGAGYVACAVPASIRDTVAGYAPALPVHALPDAPEAVPDALHGPLDKARALLIGPGLAPEAAPVVHALLDAFDGPVVLDAGALPALRDRLGAENGASERWILTPHMGEFARLCAAGAESGGIDSDVDTRDRVRQAQTHAARWNVTLLLKGYPSVVAEPGGRTLAGMAGDPALATAGTGDVLAGLIAGLAAQGLAPVDAAACAMHLGGRAAERFAATNNAHALSPTDIIDYLPATL